MNESTVDLSRLMAAQFDAAKRWLGAASLAQVLVVVLNVGAVFMPSLGGELAVTAAILAILHTAAQWRADRLKDLAESILRKLELFDGLGWPIARKEINDLLLTVPAAVRTRVTAPAGQAKNYFDSPQAPSRQRLLENLEQSAWYTKHQARRMSRIIWIASALAILLTLFTLITSLRSALDQSSADNIARVITSVIVFMFSRGAIRLGFDYDRLTQEAERAEGKARSLLDKNSATDVEALKALHDYQISRTSSPLLPGWLWNIMEREMNVLWSHHIEEKRQNEQPNPGANQ